MERMEAKGRIGVPDTAASKRFGRYKDEEGNALREAGVERNERLEAVLQAWSRFTRALKIVEPKEYYDNYHLAEIMLEGIPCDERTVEAFGLALTSFDGEMAGYFLSALINSSEGQDFIIHTQGHGSRLIWLGFENKKNIRVIGDVGYQIGHGMTQGSIVIEGDCEGHLGLDMLGGTITISGYGAQCVGEGMRGGEIHLNGGYESVSDLIEHGKVYHKGKLIVDK